MFRRCWIPVSLRAEPCSAGRGEWVVRRCASWIIIRRMYITAQPNQQHASGRCCQSLIHSLSFNSRTCLAARIYFLVKRYFVGSNCRYLDDGSCIVRSEYLASSRLRVRRPSCRAGKSQRPLAERSNERGSIVSCVSGKARRKVAYLRNHRSGGETR